MWWHGGKDYSQTLSSCALPGERETLFSLQTVRLTDNNKYIHTNSSNQFIVILLPSYIWCAEKAMISARNAIDVYEQRFVRSCYYLSWKHSHSAFMHYTLLNMLDVFSLCVVTELSLASSNSSPFPPTAQRPKLHSQTAVISWSANCRLYVLKSAIHYRIFFSKATTCPLWTSWSPLLVVAKV
jgi:hypothetical protein